MTAYFDTVDDRLATIQEYIQEDGYKAMALLRHWECMLVADVLVATQLGLPEDIQQAIFKVLLEHAVDALPPDVQPLDFDEFHEHLSHMQLMSHKLHSVFHGYANKYGQSDNPRGPVTALLARAEEQLSEAASPQRRILCMMCGDRGGYNEEPCTECGVARKPAIEAS